MGNLYIKIKYYPLRRATGGELQTILDNEECLTEAQGRHCMREVLKALKFLHDRSIAHLDLKPQNILLAGERIEGGYCFGL